MICSISSKKGSCIESRSKNSSYVEGMRDVVIVMAGHDVSIFSFPLKGSIGRSASVADEARDISAASNIGLVDGDGEPRSRPEDASVVELAPEQRSESVIGAFAHENDTK